MPCPNPMCITRGRCWPMNHSPGGIEKGTLPFRLGKTKRDGR